MGRTRRGCILLSLQKLTFLTVLVTITLLYHTSIRTSDGQADVSKERYLGSHVGHDSNLGRKSFLDQMPPPTNLSVISERDPLTGISYKVIKDHFKAGMSSENEALYAAKLITEISVAEHSSRESLTKKLKHFKSVMDSDEKRILLNIAKRLDFIAIQWNITYFLYGGALLGSFRHHDVIPWDDDFDVLVDLSQRYNLFRAISASPNYDVFVAGPRMKMWSKESRSMSKYPWAWPYVDISFYVENHTHIWDSAEEYSSYVYPKSIVFPLHKRPLAGVFFNSPRDSYANLKLTYTSIDCVTHYYSHKYEKRQKSRRRYTIPCDLLSGGVPFVHRQNHEQGVMETLMLGESVIHTLVVNEPNYTITDPFKLQLLAEKEPQFI